MADEGFYSLTESDVWQTPEYLYDLIQSHITIALDPCAGLYTFIGQENWTIEEDGEVYREDGRVLRTGIDSLDRPWDTGGVAFVNPPFSLKDEFIDKTLHEIDEGHIDAAIILTPDSTDVKSWWHNKLAEAGDVVWFSEGRIHFVDPDTGDEGPRPPFGIALHFVGDDILFPDSLFDDLHEIGDVMVRWE